MVKEYSGLTLLRASVARLSVTSEKSSDGNCTGERVNVKCEAYVFVKHLRE